MRLIVRIVLTVDGAPDSKKIRPLPLASYEVASYEVNNLAAVRALVSKLQTKIRREFSGDPGNEAAFN